MITSGIKAAPGVMRREPFCLAAVTLMPGRVLPGGGELMPAIIRLAGGV
jgi:hypothetical protein